jgi:hypothetical protein
MLHLQPPTPLENHPGLRIFLAGSIEMGKAAPWQDQLLHDFTDLEGLLLLNPRRSDWDCSWEQSLRDARVSDKSIPRQEWGDNARNGAQGA